jgi:hypothetical protein
VSGKSRSTVVRRLAAVVFVGALGAAVLASSVEAALFFLFKPTAAKPGEIVAIRTGGTPAGFTARQRHKPFQRPIRVYLVPNRFADDVHSRFDRRLHFVGTLVPDRKGRGVLRFTVPPLDTDDYAVAAWCPGCARYSFGKTFSVLRVGEDTAPRYRALMLLRLELPDPKTTCPVTVPRGGRPPLSSSPGPQWHWNGVMWAWPARDGVFTATPDNQGWPGDPPGSIATKLYWFASVDDVLKVEGERLDAASPPMVVHRVNRGQSSSWRGPTWATPVTFPSEGCWRLTARLGDVSLSYILKVSRG